MINPTKDHHHVCLYDKRLKRFFLPNDIKLIYGSTLLFFIMYIEFMNYNSSQWKNYNIWTNERTIISYGYD